METYKKDEWCCEATLLSILNREPDESIGGSAFFHTHLDEMLHDWKLPKPDSYQNKFFKGSEGYHQYVREKNIKEFATFHQAGILEARDFRDFPWGEDPQLHRMLSKIADCGELILDIASDFHMGFLPNILKYNPTACVCASDLDEQCMRTLHDCLREHLPAYNICLASFDNTDIPILDDSLCYITSIDGITSSTDNRKGAGIIARCFGQDKAIAEVYRILKPGGYFVTVEQFIDCEFDLLEIYEYCETYGKLYGIYSFDEIKTFLDWIFEDSWERAFTSAGFVIETANEYSHRLTTGELKRLLFHYTNRMGVHQWTEADIARNYLSKELFHVIADAHTAADILQSKAFQKEWQVTGRFATNEKQYTKDDIADILWRYVRSGIISEPFDVPEDFGFEIYDGSTVYVLKK